MRKALQSIGRTLFWAYERGSWPYDIMVALILVFVLATPRYWFHDQAAAVRSSSSIIQRQGGESVANAYSYRVDAAALGQFGAPSWSLPRLEVQIHDFLSRSVPELRDRTFQVEHIQPVVDSSGIPRSYNVSVRTVTTP